MVMQLCFVLSKSNVDLIFTNCAVIELLLFGIAEYKVIKCILHVSRNLLRYSLLLSFEAFLLL